MAPNWKLQRHRKFALDRARELRPRNEPCNDWSPPRLCAASCHGSSVTKQPCLICQICYAENLSETGTAPLPFNRPPLLQSSRGGLPGLPGFWRYPQFQILGVAAKVPQVPKFLSVLAPLWPGAPNQAGRLFLHSLNLRLIRFTCRSIEPHLGAHNCSTGGSLACCLCSPLH